MKDRALHALRPLEIGSVEPRAQRSPREVLGKHLERCAPVARRERRRRRPASSARGPGGLRGGGGAQQEARAVGERNEDGRANGEKDDDRLAG
jgi:hypothetical protein